MSSRSCCNNSACFWLSAAAAVLFADVEPDTGAALRLRSFLRGFFGVDGFAEDTD